MKFVISTQELNYLLSKCLNIVSAKPTIPILSNLLIEAINDELIFTATDLTVGIRCFTDAKILEEGSTTLPARKLAQLARELTAVNLEISTNSNETTEIIANSSRFKLNGMSRNEFPALPSLEEAMQITVKQAHLKEMLYRTAFAVSREDSRYVLTGVFLSIADGKATFAGTDGKRLARAFMDVNIDSSFKGTYIIPLKAVEEILKSLLEEGDAVIYLMNDKIAVHANQTIMITKLLSGDYPDIDRVIPQTSEIVVNLHREELMTLLRQISLFTSEQSHSVRFAFAPGEVTISANTMDVGEGKVSMPVNYHGKKLEIAFNPGFFLDILRHSRGETVSLAITDAYNPGVITDDGATTGASASPLFVLMPMRLNEE
ncbi:MAG: DNA polymerase III subunit beta [Parachlamydiaceae bacterium]|nr:DNA polymerase III subunit beta [Parachlamydiaceae bacterium]